MYYLVFFFISICEVVVGFFFSSRRRHTRWTGDWSSDVCSSDLDMANEVRARYAVRLGLKEVKGLAEGDAKRIVERRGAGYVSLRDLWLRTALSPKMIARLADADAFGSLGLSRRKALWGARALGRAGDQDDLPLFGGFSDSPLPPPLR